MARPLHILHIEDSVDDALLIARALKRRWPDAVIGREDTEGGMRAALSTQTWDAIISDQNMPDFSAPRALALAQELELDMPFIVASGAITMEYAVNLMKAGAHDFVQKDELARLVPALERELRDAVNRKQAEQQLHRERDNQVAILNSMDAGVYIIDQDFTIQYANPAIEAMFGPRNNHKCYEYFYDREDECPWCKNPQVFKGDSVHWEFENPINSRIFDMFDTPLTNRDGSISKLKILKDITDSKREQERLQQADKMDALGNLAGGIAHDLKNMLFPIISLTEMSIKDLPQDSSATRRLHKVLEAAGRARSLTEKIHAFSHSDESVDERRDICDLLNESFEILSPSIPATIDLECDLSEAVGEIEVDVAQFETMILNLGSNAADAIGNKVGKINLSISGVHLDELPPAIISVPKPGSYAKLCVTDTGAGMDNETLQHIFEPYFTTKEKGKGTGLGMAMVQKFVVQNDGGIAVSSVPGQGTTFEIYLPLVDQEKCSLRVRSG
ncbi:ATP-binding protein [Pseudomonadota bacterium]